MRRNSAGTRSCSSSHFHCASPSTVASLSVFGTYLPRNPSPGSPGLNPVFSGLRKYRASSRINCTRLPGGPNTVDEQTPSRDRRGSSFGASKKSRNTCCDSFFFGYSAPASLAP